MWRRLRWVLLALVVVVAGLAVAAVVTQKPTLDDDERAADDRWAALRDVLVARYASLDDAVAALTATGAGERAITVDLAADLADWAEALDGGTAAEQAAVANRLEGQGARLRANVLGSDLLRRHDELVGALGAYDSAPPPEDLVAAYNQAVRDYEDDRRALVRAPVALAFGFDARPGFVPRT